MAETPEEFPLNSVDSRERGSRKKRREQVVIKARLEKGLMLCSYPGINKRTLKKLLEQLN